MESLNWKRYVVFGIDMYYPSGGIDDVCFTTDNIEEAKTYARENVGHQKFDWIQVIDILNKTIIVK